MVLSADLLYKHTQEVAMTEMNPKEPRKEQEPMPEPVDPPSDVPPGEPVDVPNV